jgi:hypothetical protein
LREPEAELGRLGTGTNYRGKIIRDIRDDLQDRARLLEEQIHSAQAKFENLIEQFKASNTKAELKT